LYIFTSSTTITRHLDVTEVPNLVAFSVMLFFSGPFGAIGNTHFLVSTVFHPESQHPLVTICIVFAAVLIVVITTTMVVSEAILAGNTVSRLLTFFTGSGGSILLILAHIASV